MNLRTLVFAAGLVLSTVAGASASTFVVDGANSSVTLTKITGIGDAVTASLADGLDGTTFDLTSPGTSFSFDFLTFDAPRCQGLACFGIIGVQAYSISATLAFAPPAITVTSGGSAGSVILFGSITAGVLTWDDVPVQVGFGDTGFASIDFEDGWELLSGSSITTSATVTLDKVDSESIVAPVPLPASGVLLLAGIGGLAARRRSKRLAA